MAVINYIFGSVGSGKTSYLAKLARKYIKRGIDVYTNFPLKDCYLIEDDMIGKYSFENSVILLDECGISYDSRSFSSKDSLMKDKSRLQWWKLARHYLQKDCKFGCIYVASQGWDDIDKKIKTLATSYIYLRRSIIPWVSIAIPIYKKCDIDKETHQPIDYFEKSLIIDWKFIFRPRYYKYFDSFDAPELPVRPEGLEKV